MILRGTDHGSASVLVVAWIAVLAALCGGALLLLATFAARATAAAAADLGALAAAAATIDAPGSACPRADAVVRRNGARMVSCRSEGTHAWVEVSVPVPPAVAHLAPHGAQLRARAHAELRAGEG